MPQTTPILFLAFAKDEAPNRRRPARKRDELEKIFRPIEREGKYQVLTLADATPAGVLQVFQENPGRVRLFHYDGHSSEDALLLTRDFSGRADNLAQFLARQKGLELVFLSGCMDWDQAETFVETNLKAVIATHRRLGDPIARAFAGQFYQCLAHSAPIRDAFAIAGKEMAAQFPGKFREDKFEATDGEILNESPWQLFPSGAHDWRLTTNFESGRLAGDETWLLKQFIVLPAERYTVASLADFLRQDPTALNKILNGLAARGWLSKHRDNRFSIPGPIRQMMTYQSPPTVQELERLRESLIEQLRRHEPNHPATDFLPWIACARALANYLDGATHERIAVLQNYLALALQDLGDYAGARALFEKALQRNEQYLGSDHPSTARSYSNLATVLQNLGDYAEARALLEKAVQIDEHHLGPDHPTTAIRYSNLALVLQDLGDYAGARTLLEKVVQSDERHFGPSHPNTLASYANLATVLQDLGDYTGARSLLEKVVHQNEQDLGPNHSTTARNYSNLGLVLQKLGDYTGARSLFEKALLSDEQNFDPDHPTIAIRYSNLATVLKDLGDYTEARVLLEKAVQIDEQHFGPDHPNTALRYSNLALVLKTLGDYEGARSLLEKATRSAEQNFGPDHPTTSLRYANLALVFQVSGDHAGARSLLEKAVRSNEQNFGPDHPNTAQSYLNLALVLKDLGDYGDARSLLEKALVVFRHSLGEDHAYTKGALTWIGRLQKLTGP